jgi:hypothetical protein
VSETRCVTVSHGRGAARRAHGPRAQNQGSAEDHAEPDQDDPILNTVRADHHDPVGREPSVIVAVACVPLRSYLTSTRSPGRLVKVSAIS